MTRLLWTAPVLLIVLGVLLAVLAAADLRTAAIHARTAERAHAQRLANANRIVQLRAQKQTALDRRRPESDVLRLVTTALNGAGIRINPHIAPSGSAAVVDNQTGGTGSTKLMRQTVVVTLADLAPPQIGGFLAAFESVAGPWDIADITLSTTARPTSQAPQYTARLTLAAIYTADEPL